MNPPTPPPVGPATDSPEPIVPRTHRAIDARLCGTPTHLEPGRAVVTLTLSAAMASDERGLVHGGFTFALADYAAMLAVNEETVVLASATTRFLAPTIVGDEVVAEATVESSEGRKRRVKVVVRRGETAVMEGELLAVVPDRHVLDRGEGRSEGRAPR